MDYAMELEQIKNHISNIPVVGTMYVPRLVEIAEALLDIVQTNDDRLATLFDEKQAEVRMLRSELSVLRGHKGADNAAPAYVRGTDCY